MGNPDREESRGLSVLCLGHITGEAIAPLLESFGGLELAEVPLPADTRLEDQPADINRAIDAARSHWVLILRGGEMVSEELAREVAASAIEPPLAWGFRIRSETVYAGRPLRLGKKSEGEVRLVHRRHARFDLRTPGAEIKVQGPVIRMKGTLRRHSFDSLEQHRRFLEREGVPHSLPRRILLFARDAVVTGSLWRGMTTLRYLWLEAGYDLTGVRRTERER
jgi:hypothetical protein